MISRIERQTDFLALSSTKITQTTNRSLPEARVFHTAKKPIEIRTFTGKTSCRSPKQIHMRLVSQFPRPVYTVPPYEMKYGMYMHSFDWCTHYAVDENPHEISRLLFNCLLIIYAITRVTLNSYGFSHKQAIKQFDRVADKRNKSQHSSLKIKRYWTKCLHRYNDDRKAWTLPIWP